MNRVFAFMGVTALLATAGAGTIEFNFPIDTIQEVPAPNIPVGAPVPVGNGVVTLDTDTNEVSWEISYQDLTGPIVAPGAHIHGPAGPGATAGVFVFLAGGSGAPLPQPATGVLSGSTTLTAEQAGWILDGLAYVNIHTGLNQPGEIRGQVVPEPSTLALGLLALGFLRRR